VTVVIVEERIILSTVILVSILVGLGGGALVALASPVIAAAVVVALIAGVVVITNEQTGLYALVAVAALLPFGAIPINVGFYPTFLDAVLVALFGVWLVRVATRTQSALVSTPLDALMFVFLLLVFFSFVAGMQHAGLTMNTLRHFVEIVVAIALYFVVVNVVQTRQQLERAVRVIILAGFVAALIGVVLYVLPQDLTVRLLSALRVFHYPSSNVLRFIEDNPQLPMRATSTSIDPNVLGGLLVLVTALTAPQFFARTPLLDRRLVAVILGVMLVCLLLTFSRGSFIGLGLAMLVLATLRYRRMFLWMMAGLIVILVLPPTQNYLEHFQAGLAGQDLATQMRIGEYRDALNLIAKYPWFGVGFLGTPNIDEYLGVSSVYLLMAQNMGLVGLSAFLVILAVFFRNAWRAWRATWAAATTLEPILAGLVSALVGALIGGLLDHYFFNLDFPHSVALFWIYVALTMAGARLAVEHRPAPELPRPSMSPTRI